MYVNKGAESAGPDVLMGLPSNIKPVTHKLSYQRLLTSSHTLSPSQCFPVCKSARLVNETNSGLFLR